MGNRKGPTHMLFPYGEPYEVDGVKHQKYKDQISGKIYEYFDGGDGSAHVKNPDILDNKEKQ